MLLIDGNFSQKTVTSNFDLRDRCGLSEVLLGHERCADVIRSCQTPGLSVMPTGGGTFPRQPSAAGRLPEIIEQVKQHFGIVFVDAGGINETPAKSLIRWCDASCFVLPLGAYLPDKVTAAVDSVRQHGARLMGSILTNVLVSEEPP